MFFESITEPHSVPDLLRNLKAAIEHDLFLGNEFYQEPNLLLFSGCKAVDFKQLVIKEATVCRYFLTKTKQIIKGSSFGDGARIQLDRTVKMDGLIDDPKLCPTIALDLSVYLNVPAHDCAFGAVTDLFGKGWEISRDRDVPSGRVFPETSHAFGNEEIQYDFSHEKLQQNLRLEMDQDGCLMRVQFRLGFLS